MKESARPFAIAPPLNNGNNSPARLIKTRVEFDARANLVQTKTSRIKALSI
jgi:hypothetical protein